VEDTIKIVNVKYPKDYYNVFLVFDHSSGHTAFADDALNVNKVNVRMSRRSPAKNERYLL